MLQNEYNDVIKYAVAVRGLSGYRGFGNNNKMSEYFIVNSRLERKIRVFSTSHLLNALCPTFGHFNDNMATITNLPTKLDNQRVEADLPSLGAQ